MVRTPPLQRLHTEKPATTKKQNTFSAVVAAIAVVVAVATSAVAAVAAAQPPPSTTQPSTPVTVTVDPYNPGPAVPQRFLGLSFEAAALTRLAQEADARDHVW